MSPTRSGVLLALLIAGGCTFDTSGLRPGGAFTDGNLLPSNGASVELLQGVTAPLIVPASGVALLDTDTGEIVLADDTAVRSPGEGVEDGIGFYLLDNGVSVLAITAMDIGPDGALFPIGFRPIVFLSQGDVRIRGVLDASAPCDGETLSCGGPGGGDGALVQGEMSTGCAPGKNGNGTRSGSGVRTGGGGGGFLTDGAPGGEAGSGDASAGGAGGSLSASNCPGTSLEPLRGGSAGGAGAAAEFGGVGGGAGGGVQITSFTRIEVSGQASSLFLGIFANGAGGGGARDGGGGGGGSGGAILLEAPEIRLRNVFITANGGGGGGGGTAQNGTTAGEDGRIGTGVARGGAGDFPGGDGGTSATVLPTAGQGGGLNTGGGGGSAGIIRFHVPRSSFSRDGVVISPEPIIETPRQADGA